MIEERIKKIYNKRFNNCNTSICLLCYRILRPDWDKCKSTIDELLPESFESKWDENKKGVLIINAR